MRLGRVRLALVTALVVVAPLQAAPLVVSTRGLSAQVDPDPWRLAFRVDGQEMLAEAPARDDGPSGPLGFRTTAWAHATRVVSSRDAGDGLVLIVDTSDPLGRRLEVTLAPDGEGAIALEAGLESGAADDVEALGIGWQATADERYFGFGERADAVDHRGRTVENYVADGPYQEDERSLIALFVPPAGFRARDDATYFPVPWLLSSRGYGVLVDNPETSYFRLGTDRPDAWSLEVVGAPEDPEDVAAQPAPARLRLRVMAGPRPADVLRRFTERTGRQPAPDAPWVLGPWFQPGGSLDEQLAQVRKLRDADAPVSVAQTYTHYLPCGDQVGRRDAERERTAAMHARGLAITTYFNPMICTSYAPAYGDAVAAGALMRTSSGAPFVYNYTGSRIFPVSQFDFFVAAGPTFYARLLSDAVEDGHDGWMEDFGEYTPLDAYSADGRAGRETHNPYPMAYHCAAHDFVGRQARPVVRFQRSGWTGVAPCAQVVWGGDPTTGWDFDGLASAVKSALGIGLSGISTWGSDIGGFFALGGRTLTPELLVRWVQFGAVSGVMRTERTGFAVPAYVRPQIDDDDQLPNWRRYAKLRTQLYPYLVAADAEYRASGLPLMRHLVLVAPDDAVAVGREDEFLLGPDILVAPVLAPGESTRDVYLPAGPWVDLWRAARYDTESGGLLLGSPTMLDGGREVQVPAPLDELPLLIRIGAVLPLLPADVDTLADYGDAEPGFVKLADRRDTLELLAFPHGRTSARFYGGGTLRSAERRGRWSLRVRGDGTARYRLQAALGTLAEPFVPCSVRWAGHLLPPESWSYDPATGVLRAELVGGRGRLVVRGGCA